MYDYLCDKCNVENQCFTFAPIGDTIRERCEACGNIGLIRCVSNFGTKLSMPEHFNQSTGKYVTNHTAFKDQLKAKSDEMSERLNMNCNYQETDGTDKKNLGVSAEGLHEHISKEPDSAKRKKMSKAFAV